MKEVKRKANGCPKVPWHLVLSPGEWLWLAATLVFLACLWSYALL